MGSSHCAETIVPVAGSRGQEIKALHRITRNHGRVAGVYQISTLRYRFVLTLSEMSRMVIHRLNQSAVEIDLLHCLLLV